MLSVDRAISGAVIARLQPYPVPDIEYSSRGYDYVHSRVPYVLGEERLLRVLRHSNRFTVNWSAGGR
jgi:uncharacterized membrane protein